MYETLDVQKTWDIADAFDYAVPHHLDPWLDEKDSELRSELHKFWDIELVPDTFTWFFKVSGQTPGRIQIK